MSKLSHLPLLYYQRIKGYFKQLSKLPNSPTLLSTFYAINIYRWFLLFFSFLMTYFKWVILKNVISYCCQTQQRTLFIISVLHMSYFQPNDQHVPWPELGINTFFELLSPSGSKEPSSRINLASFSAKHAQKEPKEQRSFRSHSHGSLNAGTKKKMAILDFTERNSGKIPLQDSHENYHLYFPSTQVPLGMFFSKL